ncbi:hypothetical protein [Brevibacillus daliensis]|uniref:hypothetical protein n=1 Tax=Brevibacillus daliensis TaxID=2892995 RepID=UPI001E4FD053|nr:hypothetical protein [Brevibacillus daliensis]
MGKTAKHCFPCPPVIRTPLYPSPNSNLSQRKLDQQQKCIEAANNLLQALGNPQDPENTNALRLHFQSLRNMLLRITVGCAMKKECIGGCLQVAGSDFLQLIGEKGKLTFVQYDKICSVATKGDEANENEQELLHIDPCLREALVSSFGEVVSQSPFLINIFFGIPLFRQLKSFIGSEVEITSVIGDVIRGTLVASEEGQIEVLLDCSNDFVNVNLQDICFLTLESKPVSMNTHKCPILI